MPGLTQARRQRGAAALALTLLLVFAMTLLLGLTHRSLLFESRASANQYRATQAFEAAEAGLDWAQAMLNSTRPIDANCEPSADPDAPSFRERYLARGAPSAAFGPRTRTEGGAEVALRAACALGDDGWRCHCPADSDPALDPPDGPQRVPVFSVSFLTGSLPGVVQVRATGCAGHGAPCTAGADKADAHATVHQALALVPALANLPAAPLTVRGNVDAAGPGPAFDHRDGTGSGITVHAGGAIEAPAAQLLVPPGSPRGTSLVDHDAWLAGLSPEQLFHNVFRMGARRWKSQPGVLQLTCAAPCDAALGAKLAEAGPVQQLWVSGDLTLEGGITIGSPERPVVLVVDGDVRWRGAITLHGLLYADDIQWSDAPATGARLRGAAVASGGYSSNGSVELIYDRALLERLAGFGGSLVRVPGSWRDF